MEIKKLLKTEHGMTRKLWEEIFTDDSKEFLDYYYTWKTADNEIYGIEEGGKLCSMLQLNPYGVRAGEKRFLLHYIIAVATKPEFRGRGFMRVLLKRSAEEMYQRKEPFTFLMPAAEDIYYPHGFRFVYRQDRYKIRKEFLETALRESKDGKEPGRFLVRMAEEADSAEIAEFAERTLGDRYAVRTGRTEAYYRILLKEQESENGGILLAEENGVLKGTALLASDGETTDLREPLTEEAACLETLLRNGAAHGDGNMVSVSALSDGQAAWIAGRIPKAERTSNPLIMARIIHLKEFLEAMRAKREFSVRITVKDRMLAANEGVWEISGKKNGAVGAVKCGEGIEVCPEEAGQTDIADIATVLFGYESERERERNVYAALSEGLRILKDSLVLWNTVFLNEIV